MHQVLLIALIVLFGFFSVGIPLATLPSFIRDVLGFNDVWIGIVLGLQSLVTLISRHYSGTLADLEGPKVAVRRGLLLSLLSGTMTLGAVFLNGYASLIALILGRVILGLSESLMITGALAWGVGLVGPKNAGKVMSWSGMAMYGSIAAASPLSFIFISYFGFPGAISLAILLPFLAGLISMLLVASPATGVERIPFYKVLPLVWKHGMGLAFAAVSFAGIAGFSALLFKQNNWEHAPWLMTIFGITYVIARIFFGHTPDTFGGRKVAMVSTMIAILGQLMIWQAGSSILALCGAAFTGFGYSLVFPAFGVEAVKNLEGKYRGVALGAYVAFFDLALGVTGPIAGFVANVFGYPAVFALGMIACSLSFLIAISLKQNKEFI